MATEIIVCQCGQADGSELCAWTGPITETVRVNYLPSAARRWDQTSLYDAMSTSRAYELSDPRGMLTLDLHTDCVTRIRAAECGWLMLVDDRVELLPRMAHERLTRAGLDPAVWPAPDPGVMVERQPAWLAWVHLAPDLLAAVGRDGECWVAVDVGDMARTWYGFGYPIHHIALRYQATPERMDAIRAAVPAWTELETVERAQHARWAYGAAADAVYAAWREIDPNGRRLGEMSAEADQARARAVADVWAETPIRCKPGRYAIRHEGHAGTDRDALDVCMVRGVPLEGVTVDCDAQLVYTNGESVFGGHPFALWSDGVVTRAGCASPSPTTLPDAAAALLKHAVRQQVWLEAGQWRDLLDVVAIEVVATADQMRQRHASIYSSGSAEVVLEQLSVRHADGRGERLYRVGYAWGVLAEDGDAGDGAYLYRDEDAARAKFAQERSLYV